ncbi:8-amino-7-oxononanoate synthase [Flagellimonas maritima]|uniref:8-amino-7-oxononanoate synthase n=1 Tax=Flagellimonas maritima TaxID=1383885 RepID=A0A2Z4LN39_9FLAO|nr:aminotransferase class I/II-fold pyridoxal phosphate-dependent enzyme [Allomuricauda aurantiaca]AWX43176.1 8-amino-7-oxononanoate synthase [Allomuricauda aurantiaca]
MIHHIDFFPGRTITIKNREYRYFGGTSYLGLQTDKNFQDIFIENTRIFGTNYGASRKSNVQMSIFEKAEGHLANIVGSEACISLSSGYLAGQLISQFLNTNGYHFFYAPNTHSALYHREVSAYPSFEELNDSVRKHLNSNEKSIPVIFLDSIDFSGLNYPSFMGLQSLPLEKIIVVADDSHGIGILGKNGGGVYQILKKLEPKELIVCCSLGKGYGIQGGAIFGTKNRVAELKNTIFFGGASPAAPVGLATLVGSEKIYEKKRIALKNNIELFLNSLKQKNKFEHMPNHPAFGFSDDTLANYLEENNILITNFKYPNEDSVSTNRIIISAAHKKEDIQYLVRCLNTLS